MRWPDYLALNYLRCICIHIVIHAIFAENARPPHYFKIIFSCAVKPRFNSYTCKSWSLPDTVISVFFISLYIFVPILSIYRKRNFCYIYYLFSVYRISSIDPFSKWKITRYSEFKVKLVGWRWRWDIYFLTLFKPYASDPNSKFSKIVILKIVTYTTMLSSRISWRQLPTTPNSHLQLHIFVSTLPTTHSQLIIHYNFHVSTKQTKTNVFIRCVILVHPGVQFAFSFGLFII